MTQRPEYPLARNKPEELQSMNVVVLRGISEKDHRLCAMGWVEDKPHDGESAVALQEPLYFYPVHSAPGATVGKEPVKIAFLPPEYGVPASAEFFEYTRIDIYEGIHALAICYIEALVKARKYVPMFEPSWVTPPLPPTQVSAPQGRVS